MIEYDFIEIKSRSTSDPTFTDIDFKNEISWVWTLLKKYSRTVTQVYFQLINQQTKLLMEQQQKINSLRQIIFGGQNQNLNQSEPDASSILRLQMAAQLQVNINYVIIT